MRNALGILLFHICFSSGVPSVPARTYQNSNILKYFFPAFLLCVKKIKNHNVGYDVDMLCSPFLCLISIDKQICSQVTLFLFFIASFMFPYH